MSRFIDGGNPHIPDFTAYTNKAPEKAVPAESAQAEAEKKSSAPKLPQTPSTMPVVMLKDDKGYMSAVDAQKTVNNAKGDALAKDGPHTEATAHQAATMLSAMGKANPDLMSGKKLSPGEISSMVDSIMRASYGNAAVDKSYAVKTPATGTSVKPGVATKSAKLPTAPNARLSNSGHDEASVDNNLSKLFGRAD